MALTRKMLKAMGIEEEKIDQIIEMHGETVDALKAQIAAAKEGKEPAKESKAEPAKKAEKPEDSEAYKSLKAELDKLKEEKANAAKEKAARAYFESKNITGKNLDIAIRGARAEIDALELDGDKIKDSKALESLVAGDYSGLVVKTEQSGAKTATPPASTGKPTKTKEEIMAIKDDSERWNAMRENPALFGLDK